MVGFPAITVPALKINGRKVQGSREIARELDRDAARAAAVPGRSRAPRRRSRRPSAGATRSSSASPAGSSGTRCKRNRAPLASYSEGAKLGVPIGLAVKTGQPLVAGRGAPEPRRPTRTSAPTSPRCPGCSSASTTGSPRACSAASTLNAADLQIGASVRLLMTLEDLRARDRLAAGRRAGDAGRSRTTPATRRRSCRRPGSSRRCATAEQAPRRLSRPAAQPSSGPTRSTRCARARAPRAPRSSRVPSGSASSGSSSSSGSSTNRRRRHLAVRQGQPLASASSTLAEQQQVDVERARARGAGRRARAPARPRSPCRASSSCLGLELGRGSRIAALRKSGWSRISPTGSVS